MPQYTREEKMPKLPTEKQINTLIAGSGKTLSLKLWLSKETGLRPVELHALKVKNLDTEHQTINPTTAKHGAGRILKISPALSKALLTYIIKNEREQNSTIFRSDARKYGNNFREMRNALAKKLNQPELASIRLYDLRHYFGTMQYWKYRDVALTAFDMGHKDWNTTQKYIHLLRIIELSKEDGWICKTATTPEEIKQLIEADFQYVTEADGLKFFKKRK